MEALNLLEKYKTKKEKEKEQTKKVDQKEATIDSLAHTIKYIKTELEHEMKDIKRAESLPEQRHIFHQGRNKFGGESRTYNDICYLNKEMNVYKINSVERMNALEAFCIYGSTLLENIEKLYKIGALKNATSSLATEDKRIFLRAITLISMITDDNPEACSELNDVRDIKYIFTALSSSRENFRLEALNIVKNMTKAHFNIEEFKKYDIVTKSIILIEEGLSMKTEIGGIQVIHSLNLI